jgi:hypothetical protein
MLDPTNPKEAVMLKLALCGLSPHRVLPDLDLGAGAFQELPERETAPARRGGTQPVAPPSAGADAPDPWG